MRLHDEIDFTTLGWVKQELDETLKQARQALEAFVEDPEDSSQMRFCATYLHQVQGTLRMVELYGAAMVLEEMEALAHGLLDESVPRSDAAYDVLMRGIVQLPGYLERLQSGHRDVPVVLLPLLNDLRGAQAKKLLTESVMFKPRIDAPLPASVTGPAEPLGNATLLPTVDKLRKAFEAGLLQWFRIDDPSQILTRMIAISDKLTVLTSNVAARRIWWIASGVLDAVKAGAIESSITVQMMFGKVSQELKRFAADGELAFAGTEATERLEELAKNLLYYAAHVTYENDRINELKQTYLLEDMAADEEEIEHAQSSLAGHDRELLDTVSSALKEDLMKVKDALDLKLRQADTSHEGYGDHLETLTRVANALDMLDLAGPKKIVQQQHELLGQIASGQRDPDEQTLLDVAGSMLYVEALLEDNTEQLGQVVSDDQGDGDAHDELGLPRSEVRKILDSLMKESSANLQDIKQAIVDFIEAPWDHARIEQTPTQLQEIDGALRMMDLEPASRLLSGIEHYVSHELLHKRVVPNGDQLDRLADSVASLEYYLEAVREQRPGRGKILQVGMEALAKLGVDVDSIDADQSSVAVDDAIPAVEQAIVEVVADQTDVAEVEPEADLAEIEPDAIEEVAAGDVARDEAESVEEDGAMVAAGAVAAAAIAAASERADAELEEARLEPTDAEQVSAEQPGFEPSAVKADISDDIDEEIREIFIEEVEEELENLQSLFPQWKENPEDVETLTTIRRIFHTLKGSGRLVGATTIGEFSWSVENMLNRVLDGSRATTPAVTNLMGQAVDTLPQLLAFVKGEAHPTADVDAIAAVADRVADGEEITYEAPALAEPVADAAGTEAVAATEPVADTETPLDADSTAEPEVDFDTADLAQIDTAELAGLDELVDNELAEEVADSNADIVAEAPDSLAAAPDADPSIDELVDLDIGIDGDDLALPSLADGDEPASALELEPATGDAEEDLLADLDSLDLELEPLLDEPEIESAPIEPVAQDESDDALELELVDSDGAEPDDETLTADDAEEFDFAELEALDEVELDEIELDEVEIDLDPVEMSEGAQATEADQEQPESTEDDFSLEAVVAGTAAVGAGLVLADDDEDDSRVLADEASDDLALALDDLPELTLEETVEEPASEAPELEQPSAGADTAADLSDFELDLSNLDRAADELDVQTDEPQLEQEVADAIGDFELDLTSLDQTAGTTTDAEPVAEDFELDLSSLDNLHDGVAEPTDDAVELADWSPEEAVDQLIADTDFAPEPNPVSAEDLTADLPVDDYLAAAEADQLAEEVVSVSTVELDAFIDQEVVDEDLAETVEEPADLVALDGAAQPQIDPTLYEILRAEVTAHLGVMRDYRDTMLESEQNVPATDELLRAAHTMNGAVSMAEVPALVQITAPLEGYIKRLRINEDAPSGQGLDAIDESIRYIDNAVDQLGLADGEIADATPLAGALESLRDGLPEGAGLNALLELGNQTASDVAHDQATTEAEQAEAERLEQERLEAEKAEAERLEQQRLEAEQAEAERLEQERLEAEQAEAERLEQERLEAEQAEAERSEQERLEAEQAEAERLEQERLEAEQAEAERLEQERLEAEQAEAERLEQERLETEQAEAKRSEQARLEAEQAEQERLEAEQAEAERLEQAREAEQAEAERLAAEQQAIEQEKSRDVAAAAALAAGAAAVAFSGSDDEDFVELSDLGEMDDELLDIFLQEGAEILDTSDNKMAEWREDPAAREPVTELQRELHTLKGGARMAGLSPIGDLSHMMESLFEAIVGDDVKADTNTVELLERSFDRLHQMLGRVSQQQPIPTGRALIARIESTLAGEVIEDAAAPTPAAEQPSEPAPVVIERETALDQELQERGVVRQQQELIRVRADLLDNLVNNAGEVSIYRSRLEQQVGTFRFNLVELDQTVLRLRDQLRKLEIETEVQILSRFQREAADLPADETFDPLEMDRFSTIQQLSRALAESVSDLTSIGQMLSDLTRESETLLLQQSRVASDLQEGLMRTRMVPFDSLVPRLRRIVRQTAGELEKKAQLRVDGAHGEMDRTVLERVTAPLEHMLRNAVAHGLEQPDQRTAHGKPAEGSIKLQIAREATEVVLTVTDDGAGIDAERIRAKAIERGILNEDAELGRRDLYGFILHTGFSTADEVTKVAGRGVGMDVVNSEIKQLGGSLEIDSEQGQGTTFTIRLPFTLAVTNAIMVKIGDTLFAVPLTAIEGVVRMRREDFLRQATAGETYSYTDQDYQMLELSALLGMPRSAQDGAAMVPVLMTQVGDQRAAVLVDAVVGSREIVVKSVGPQISSVPGIFGATILGDGSIVMILDLGPLIRRNAALQLPTDDVVEVLPESVDRKPLVAVVDDSITMRKVTSRVLERNEMDVMTAKDGVDAVEQLQERIPDLMLLDIEMPRMDGYELATHIRNDSRLKHIPIIMITSRTGAKHRERAMDIGVNRYLGKPYQEGELMENVRELLEEKASTAESN